MRRAADDDDDDDEDVKDTIVWVDPIAQEDM